MKPRLIKYIGLHQLTVLKHTFSRASLDNLPKGRVFRQSRLKPGMKTKYILAIALVAILLVSVFAWLSAGTQSDPNIVEPVGNDPIAAPSPTSQQTTTPNQTKRPTVNSEIGNIINKLATSFQEILAPTRPPGLVESSLNSNSTLWKAVATNAWKYFQPDTGVDPKIGLPKASLDYPYFTDWDLGVYIQTIIDAQKVGLINATGDWGSTARIQKVLTFLETRELNNDSYPFWFYQAADGKNYNEASDRATTNVDAVDTGRLFIALNNLKTFNSSLASRIDNFVYNRFNNRSNYAAIVPDIKSESIGSTSIYAYYYASGFASFWPTELSNTPTTILNNILTAGNITDGLYGVSLPNATISCEPLFCSVFELNNDHSELAALAKQVYLAHEAKYNITEQYVAFSEGNSKSSFIYEWVVLPNGDTWKITNAGESIYSDVEPIIFTKIALSFLALYNTTFARNMAIYLEKAFPDPTWGYYAGADHNSARGANLVLSIDSNTNGMILSAARYVIQKNS